MWRATDAAPGLYDVDQRQNAARLSQVTAYLPKAVAGKEIVTSVGENMWRATDAAVGKALGIAYRREKQKHAIWGEDHFLGWGLTVQGVDEGDGWVRVQIPMANPPMEQANPPMKKVPGSEGLGIPLAAKDPQARSNASPRVLTAGLQPAV